MSRSTPAALVGLSAMAVLVLGLFLVPHAIVQGWVMAFVAWSGVPIGSLTLLLTHRLVGGRWGEALGPVLLPATSLLPFAAIAFLPLVFDLSAIYPWAADPAAAPPGVALLYLNAPSFLVRAVIALGGWSVLAVLIVSGRCSQLAAALGLAFHGLMISVVAVDWILSVELGYPSSSFAAGIAIQQILSALAFTAVVAPDTLDEGDARDLSGLLIACLLGLVYLDLMAYIVAWYGNLPDKAAWYLRRSDGWGWVILAAMLVGALLPFSLLLSARVRRSRIALRWVGALILLGIALHVLWLLGPEFEAASLLAGAVALVAVVGVSFPLAARSLARMQRKPAHA